MYDAGISPRPPSSSSTFTHPELTVHGKLERGRRGKIVDDTNDGELRLRSGEEAGLRKERGSGRY
jgi:hypothetical protein